MGDYLNYVHKNIGWIQLYAFWETQRRLKIAKVYDILEKFGNDNMKAELETIELKLAQIYLDEVRITWNKSMTDEARKNIDNAFAIAVSEFYEKWISAEQRKKIEEESI